MSKNTSPYHEAGWLLNELLPTDSNNGNKNEPSSSNQKQRRGLKSLAFDTKSNKKAPNKATYATVCKTMQNLPVINSILNANGKEMRKAIGFDSVRNKGLVYVMLYELLFGKYKSIRGGGKIKRMIIKQEKELRKGADDYIAKHGLPLGADRDSKGVHFPRYVRVNVLRSSAEDVIQLLDEGFSANSGKTKGDPVEESARTTIFADAHVPDLLVLPPSASSWLHQSHEAVKSGKIVLQDKSSCFSALVMARGHSNDGALARCDYIDACSAPGNKTSHLAALVHASILQRCGHDENFNHTTPKKKKKNNQDKPKSTIFAFERSSTRFKILQSRMDLLCPSSNKNPNASVTVSVEPTHGDFLKCNPNDPKYANVRAILLDPSCSGSGIVNSPDRWMEETNDSESATNIDGGSNNENNNMSEEKKKRIQSLSNFQLLALKHAMSFPNVDRIVYSTCSVHDEENEVVVGKALAEANSNSSTDTVEEEGKEWELVSPACLQHWPRRGNEGGLGGLTSNQASCLIRCDGLDGDETNGFFVSYFERKRMSATREPPSNDLGGVRANQRVDIPVYNGEFLITRSKSKADTSSDRIEDETVKALENGSSLNNLRKKAIESASDSNKSEAKSAKKRAKKLAWKKKQAQLKAQRLKEKHEKKNDTSVVVQKD
ncbi:hypothetical protein ACHAXS_014312 [Conticribra weissflogii]